MSIPVSQFVLHVSLPGKHKLVFNSSKDIKFTEVFYIKLTFDIGLQIIL